MTADVDPVARAAIDAAFHIIELLRAHGDDASGNAYHELSTLIDKHGPTALGAVWLIWGRVIALGLDDRKSAPAAMYSELDGDPRLDYARRAVILAKEENGEGMAQLLDAVIRDEHAHRTGATVHGVSAVLAIGAIHYGGTPPTKDTPPTTHE